MRFSETVPTAEPTHRLVTRQLPDVKDWDDAGALTAENRAMDVFVDYGTTVHLEIDSDHGQFETVRRELERVPEPERVFAGSTPEYRAELPADRPLVESLLEIPAEDTDAWTERLFAIDTFAVLSDETWVYRSVPHETHIREINAREHEGLIADLNDVLGDVRGSTVVPFDGVFASWTIDGNTYTLEWGSLRRESGENAHVVYDLKRLQYVTVRGPEPTLYLGWRPPREESTVRRILWWLLCSDAADPSTRIGLPDEDHAREVLDAFRQLRGNLDYEYEVAEIHSV